MEQRGIAVVPYEAGKTDVADEHDGKESAAQDKPPLDEEAAAEHHPRPLSPYRSHRSRREVYKKLFTSQCFTVTIVLLGIMGYLLYYFLTKNAKRGQEELRLTGESHRTFGHGDLFRICASSFLAPDPFTAHTCNVYRPLHDVNAPPIHAFTEEIRHWESWSAADKGPHDSTMIQPVSLETLLLDQGLKCAPAGNAPSAEISQLVVGHVGSYGKSKVARTCYYDEKGNNMQDHCAQYGDGGQSAWGTPRPLSINEIFQTHFGMNCTWIEGQTRMV